MTTTALHSLFLFMGAVILSLVLTPIVKKLAIAMGAVDKPDPRKVHKGVMPRMGGLAIFGSFVLSYVSLLFFTDFAFYKINMAVIFGGFIIVLTGIVDDLYQISPKKKMLGQFAAAMVVVLLDVRLEFINLPFLAEPIHFGWLSYPITIFWIIGITNAVNLIDGLDGLAAGVSAIAASSLAVISFLMGNVFIATLCIAFVGSLIGFLYYNFHPAKIFMGDAGSLFLGFFLSVVSLIGFKQVTVATFAIPVLLLAIPISDTFYAMVRRKINKLPISAPDKNHLHHRLLALGFSHRKTVLTIYCMSAVFSACAIWMTQVALWVSIVVFFVYLVVFHFVAECLGMMKADSALAKWMQRIRHIRQ
ncbi:MraY family glycosyltransferase [Bacillus bombysepticus]|uniref:glycosyltransferase family 4 protein n=1 Tax=Bacillus bombysepticus TaxID=658666 RepID=UPI003017CB4B